MRGLPQKQNARRADKIRLCGHLGRYKKIVKKTYIIFYKYLNEYSKYNTLLISSILFIFVGVFVLDFLGLIILKIIYLQKVYL